MVPPKKVTAKAPRQVRPVTVDDTAISAIASSGVAGSPALSNGTIKPAATRNGTAPTPDQVRSRAYEIFIARGSVHGHDLADWFRAEQELCGRLGQHQMPNG